MNAERGVALIMWMFIVMIVLFAISAVLGYTQFVNNTDLQLEMDKIAAERDKVQADLETAIKERSEAYMAIGFGASQYGERSNLQLVKDTIAAKVGKFNTLTDADGNLESVLTGMEKAYDDSVRATADANSKYQEARQAEQAAEDETQAVSDQKDSEIDQLRQQLTAEQDRAARAQGQAQSTVDSQRDRISTLENTSASQTEDHKREKNQLENKLLAMDARMMEINTRNRIIRENLGPDGSVVGADDKLGLVYIDAGAKHGLKRGTRFKVWSYGKGRSKTQKGEIEVRELKDDYAVCGVVDSFDKYNPIGKGDQISNVYFDRDKKVEFVFLGELPGRYNNEEATRILLAKGADVADSVSANTDFLVVGSKPAGDESEALEETETFRLAELYGVEILQGSQLVDYIHY